MTSLPEPPPAKAPQPPIIPLEQPVPTPVPQPEPTKAREIGGAKGPDPTRFGDWEHNGRCTDF